MTGYEGATVRAVMNRCLIVAADIAGHAARSVPALGGVLLTCYGLWLAWEPLGFIAGGGFLLLLDRKVP